jgi:two-component system, sensor histidine kinase
MNRFRDYSIKTKLTVLAVASSAIALTLCCAGFVSNDVRMIRAAKVEECQALANMLGFNSTAALSFRDAKAAHSLLQSLESQPAIDHAALLDVEGKMVAAYDRNPREPMPPPIAVGEGCAFIASGPMELWHPIVDDGNRVGTLLLCANMDGLRARLYDYGKITLVVMVLALNVVVFFSSCMQKFIAQPILDLAETARRISEDGDYSVRAGWDSEDELGGLHMAFNLMLDQIESSEAALQSAHADLEQRVLDRTAQLRAEIVEREKIQLALEHARDAAESANRAKSEFLANMSHEIRTPLNAVLGFTDLLQMGGDEGDDAKRQEYLGLIHTSGEHLLGLINDVLDLSKIESGRLEVERVPCSPQQIVADVISVLRVRANEKGLALEYHWEEGVPMMVLADPGRLRQLLVNLVGNAIKFTAQGRVQVVGRLVPSQNQNLLAFQVIDTGVGIPQDKLDDIFDPFVQADSSVTRKFGGTGLGLAISRRIVEAMGGTLTVHSEVGRGTIFTATVEVNCLSGAAMAAASCSDILPSPKPPGPPAAEHASGRILVVEDGETNRKVIELILRRAKLEVVTAENGKLGVDAAMAEPFDLILMDMQMPVMDGYTAARTLRENGLALPIIALTAHALAGDEQKCLAAGCSGFMTKPIHAASLLRAIDDIIARSRVDHAAAEGALAGPGSDACVPRTRDALHCALPLDDPEIVEIVEEFIDHVREQLAVMRQALEKRDFTQIARLAHWLKGSGGTAGFAAFTEPARRLEEAAKNEQCDQIECAIAELVEISSRIVKPSQCQPAPSAV